jgi:DNA-binding response OmpR family regulator
MNRDDCPKPIWIDGVLYIPVLDHEIVATLRAHGNAPARDRRRALLRLSEATRTIHLDESRAQLTRIEFAILSTLIEADGQIVTLRNILGSVWGSVPARSGPELLRTHIRNLRIKLAVIGVPDSALNNVRGEGYRFRYAVEIDEDLTKTFLDVRSA